MIDIKLQSFGATAGQVTGSKHFLKINDRYIGIDYGAWQGDALDYLHNLNYKCPVPINQLETMILTHAHLDHCGLLPKLIQENYKKSILSTPATRDLVSITLLDSAKVQTYNPIGQYFTEKDAIGTLKRFKCYPYHKKKQVNENVSLTFYDAGHILGSAFCSIEVKKSLLRSTNILFTGDLGRPLNSIVNSPEIKFESPIDYLILESTYGDKNHLDIGFALQKFSDIVNITLAREGKLIIPVFAIERAQEIIYFIKLLMNSKQIPRVPVYLDSPMSVNATGVFNIHPECFNQIIQDEFISKGKNPFSISSLQCITDREKSIKLAKSKKPCIVLSSSGMCEGGHILNHLQFGLKNPLNTILFVGYQGEQTRGRKILNREKVNISNSWYEVKADVHNINSFSSHADQNEILNWLKKLDTSQLKTIFLVHGETTAQKTLKNTLEKNNYNVEIVQDSKIYKL